MHDPQLDPSHKPGDVVLNPYEAGVPPEPPRKQRGCFFYGCIIAIILAVLMLITFAAVGYLGYSYYNKMIQEWTATTPVELPKVALTDDQRKELDDRFDKFKKALDDGEAADLVLTADDLNAKIEENEELKGNVYVSIDNDEISAKVSWPLDKLGLPGTKGRFFNGSGTFKVSIDDGDLVVYAQELEANGKKLPPEVKTQLAKENLAKNINTDANTAKYIRKFESIKIKDGKVYIKARARHKEESDEEKSKVEEKKGDEPKAEEKKAEEPKAEEKKADEPAPKAEEKKAEPPAAPKEEPKKEEAPKRAAA